MKNVARWPLAIVGFGFCAAFYLFLLELAVKNYPKIPGHELIDELGQGGMATVYLAKQIKFDRVVAVKVMAPQLAADLSFRERFLREARIVAKISHPNIVAVYDVGEHQGFYYLSMEYHTEGDLKQRIMQGIDAKECLYILKDICKALHFAHERGIIHRDIKPDNVLFRPDRSAVLADFGIAKALEAESELTQLGTMAGTPTYMSPEQARGETVSHKADLYSVGIVLFEMLMGYAPYRKADPIATAMMHVNAELPTLRSESSFLQPLLNKLMAKEPDDRYESGMAVIEDVNQLIRFIENDETIVLDRPTQTLTFQDKTLLVSESTQHADNNEPVGTGKRAWRMMLGGVVTLITAGVVGRYALSPSQTDSDVLTDSVLPAAVSSDVATIDNTPTIERPVTAPPDNNRLLEVTALQKEFEALFAKNRIRSPENNNASLINDQILEFDPVNEQALVNIERMGNRYGELALNAAGKREFEQAGAYLKSAAIFLKQTDLDIYSDQVEAARSSVTDERKKVLALRDKLRVQALLSGAELDLKEQRISSPADNNAIAKYREVLVIQPDNEMAKAALKKLNVAL